MILGSLLLKYLRLERHFKPLLPLFAPLEEKRISFGGVEHLVHLNFMFFLFRSSTGSHRLDPRSESLLVVPSAVPQSILSIVDFARATRNYLHCSEDGVTGKPKKVEVSWLPDRVKM